MDADRRSETAGGYDVAWKNTGSGQYTVWSIDSNGNYKGNFTGGAVSGTSVALELLEPVFQQDLNHDGVVGLYVRPGTTLEIHKRWSGHQGRRRSVRVPRLSSLPPIPLP